MGGVRRSVGFLAILGCLAATAGGAWASPAPRTTIPELRLSGVVDPFTASYITRGIADANKEGDPAVLLTIDTPGGLDSSMRQIVQAILTSRAPVICYTAPSGARAASAGTFIMLSCPVAAMAPGTNIGAAHPVGVSGAIEQTKVTNDAAAFIRSLAERWGRNADWAERAVRDSVSVAADEAVRIHVADLVSPNTAALLAAVGPCQPGPRARPATGLLARRGALAIPCDASVVERRMGLGASILHGLISPDFAFLFFWFGIALIVIELLHPGISVPGILGVLFLVAAFISFGLLPVQLIGVVLLVASAGFFLIELKHPGFGAPTVLGLTSLVLGGLYLFNSAVPNARVSLWVIGVLALGVALFFVFVVRAVVEAKRMPRPEGPEELVGLEGVAATDLSPRGQVRARHEVWSARSTGVPIKAGASVRVVAMEGLRLVVEPAGAERDDDRRAPAAGEQPAAKGGGR